MFSVKRLSLAAATTLALFGTTAANAALTVDETFSDQWFEGLGEESRGWNVQVFRSTPEAYTVFVVGFVYDDDGDPTWVAGSTTIRPDTFDFDVPLQEFDGGAFGPGSGNPVGDAWGTLNMVFEDCNTATFSWSGNDEVADGSVNLSRVPADFGDCVYQEAFTACPTHPNVSAGPVARSCILQGGFNTPVLEDIELTNNITWLLNGTVFVGAPDAEDNDVNMWVQPGTRIVGIGSGGIDALVVSRGGKFWAEGQPYAPIVLSSPDFAPSVLFPEDVGASAGDWGGLVVNGFGTINVVDGGGSTAQGEGNSGTYGGSDDNDSSGILRYLRVQFAGNLITDLDELNGIAFQGTGGGTVADNIQVHANSDDGIEWFGGQVNVKRAVVTAAQDDSLDWTQGWTGRLQYGLVVQQQSNEVETDRGMEMDNFSDGQNNLPRSQPRISHVTLIGKEGETGMTMRAGTGGNFSNFLVYNFSTCMDIDEESTFTAAGSPQNITGTLTWENFIIMCDTNFADDETETDDDDNPIFTDPWLLSDFFNAQPGNVTGMPQLQGTYAALFPVPGGNLIGFNIDRDGFGNHPGFDAFFEDAPMKGAFLSEGGAWHYQWTEFIGETLPPVLVP